MITMFITDVCIFLFFFGPAKSLLYVYPVWVHYQGMVSKIFPAPLHVGSLVVNRHFSFVFRCRHRCLLGRLYCPGEVLMPLGSH